ncbi:MAG: hypothetical protein CBD13_003710 [Candidatus Pelagibacter sp. TMED153]|jgi:hypothetical protein|nr:MAG: hypothetical protein CBD13_003710 [Candidatus Pelagibacter sp. TMED153]|tara:strand:+ start:481 stop:867 length:387 start_codon:yes stop_codon:yes gene_type:complete
MKVEVSNGELLDKLTILELKMSNISDDKKLINVRKEFNELNPLAKLLFEKFKDELLSKYKELALINSQLWKIEDDIRECEKNKNFGEKFVELARAVYFTNDKRSDVKKQINILTGSGFIEEKSYEDYE